MRGVALGSARVTQRALRERKSHYSGVRSWRNSMDRIGGISYDGIRQELQAASRSPNRLRTVISRGRLRSTRTEGPLQEARRSVQSPSS